MQTAEDQKDSGMHEAGCCPQRGYAEGAACKTQSRKKLTKTLVAKLNQTLPRLPLIFALPSSHSPQEMID